MSGFFVVKEVNSDCAVEGSGGSCDARRERRGTAAVVARRRAVYIAIAEVSGERV